jgi:membrane associated rhomboid family serine protease
MIPLYDDQPTRSSPFVTVALIVANVLVFAAWQLQVGIEQSVKLAALVPAEVSAATPGGGIYIFTSMFMHGSWLHLIGNAWFLWIFGNNIEDVCGHIRFLLFYAICGALAAGAHIFVDPASTIPLVGASGAVSGVLGGYLMIHPHARVRTLIPIPLLVRIVDVPAFVFLLLWIGLQVFSQITSHVAGARVGIAYVAHIAGFVAGMLLIKVFVRRRDHRLSGSNSWVRNKSDERTWG